MELLLNKIKHKLFIFFLLIASISLLAVITSIWFYNKKEKIAVVADNLNEVNILSLKSFKLQQDFLNYEAINPLFFETNHSLILDEQKKVASAIKSKFKKIRRKNNGVLINVKGNLDSIELALKKNKSLFDKIIELVKERGYQDYGAEGGMRKYAHELMQLKDVDQINILMLRRHEKDYIIRKEDEYIKKFNSLIIDVENEIDRNPSMSVLRKKRIITTVDNYFLAFRKMVAIEKKLGMKQKSGLLLRLTANMNQIQNYFEVEKQFVHETELSIYNRLNYIALILSFSILVLTVFLSYIFATTLTHPIINLTASLKEYVSSNFTNFPLKKEKSKVFEIEALKENILKMSHEITNHVNSFKEKVEERTQEIVAQKNEILLQQGEIILQRDLLKNQKEILEIRQKEILEKNNNIIDSIQYAKRIQHAILPLEKTFHSLLPNSFVYNEPKDIVSGDFFWIGSVNSNFSQTYQSTTISKKETTFNQDSSGTQFQGTNFEVEYLTENNENSIILFAAVDCTGHGVPGALMSIIGHNSLTKIINEYKFSEPAAILTQLNHDVRQTLRQEYNNSEIRDGMDIALCSLDVNNKILQFSGANNPLFLVRDKEIEIIKGDKFPIGAYTDETIPSFTNHTVELQKGDSIYIFSDGYVDQFGGENGKKFKLKMFKEVILSIQDKPMKEQKQHLKETIEKWRGNLNQVDDMLIIGVKI